jgi:cytoskeletal protein CcmA (bactofilin family)
MLPLPSTKYPNVQRTVTGLVDIFPDDVILNCDTSTGAVTINLGEIPYNTTTGVGYWSTQYKLYINDISNNAGTNNITLVAGLGQTINNAATAVLSSNGANAYVVITGNTEYSVFYAPAQATPTNFISVTYAQLSALITANTLIPSANYNVTDAEFGSTPIIPTSIYIQALTTNTVSLSGQGYFLNADYQGVGDYSGVVGFTAQLGVWTLALVTPIGSVVIWNNFQYVNTTGVNGVINPQTDTVNWTVLSRVVTNGYVVEISFISYSPTNNRIVSRRDRFNNFVERTVRTFRNSLNFFKWGSVDVRQNNVSKDSVLYNCNVITAGANSFFGNDFFDSEVILGNTTTDGGTIVDWSNNVIELSPINFKIFGGKLINNKFNKFDFQGENTGTIQGNIISSATLDVNNSGTIENNVFKNIRTFTITVNSGDIINNQVISGSFEITTENKGSINNNIFNTSSFNIDTNETNASISNNTCDTSVISIITSEADISYNTLENESRIIIGTNSSTGGVKYFNIINNSSVQLPNITQIIGVGSKGAGVSVSNASILRIGTYNPAVGTFYGNIITNKSDVRITNYNNLSVFVGNTIDSTVFNTTDLNNQDLTNNFFKGVIFGGLAPNAPFPVSFSEKTAMAGNSTVEFELDCADPTVYDLANQRLILNDNIKTMGGIYKLVNAGGLTIAKIGSLSNKWVTEFYTDSGVTTFQGVSIVGALPEEIVSSSGAIAFNITTHALGYDSMFFIDETVTVVRNTNILA